MNTRLRAFLNRKAETWAPPLERFFERRGVHVGNVTEESSTLTLRGGWGGSKAVWSMIRWHVVDIVLWIIVAGLIGYFIGRR